MYLTDNRNLLESLAPAALPSTGDRVARPHVIIGSRDGSEGTASQSHLGSPRKLSSEIDELPWQHGKGRVVCTTTEIVMRMVAAEKPLLK
jgi:hypothetical protein